MKNLADPLSPISLYAPMRFEIPWSLQWKTSSFGMGKMAAERLVSRLQKDSSPRIILFGSAGALNPKIRVGQTFIVSSLAHADSQSEISIPKDLQNLPTCRLWTSPRLISSPEEKQNLFQTQGYDLVDMEMAFIWMKADPSLRSRLVFVRSIIDEADHAISVGQLSGLLRLAKNWPGYLRGLSAFLERIIKNGPKNGPAQMN